MITPLKVVEAWIASQSEDVRRRIFLGRIEGYDDVHLKVDEKTVLHHRPEWWEGRGSEAPKVSDVGRLIVALRAAIGEGFK